MRRTTLGLVGLVVLASVAAFTAVSASAKPKAKPSATTTLRILSQLTAQKGTDNMIAGFKRANPDVDINVTYSSSGTTAGTLLATQINAGNPPDILLTSPGTIAIGVGRLAPEGKMVDLSKESWVRNVPKVQRSLLEHRGKLYGFPVSSYYFGMEYSHAIFRRAGVRVPTTMLQLLRACRTIKSRTGITPIALGAADTAQGATAMWNIMAQQVYAKKPNWNTLRARKRVRFATSREWKNVFSTVSRMRSAGCFSDGVTGETLQSSFSALLGGRAAMFLFTNFILGGHRAAAPAQDIQFFSFPADRAKDTRGLVNVSGYGITSTRNVDAAKKFIAYLATPANNSGYNKISGGISYTQVKKGKLPAGNTALAKTVKLGGQIDNKYRLWPNQNMFFYTGTALQSYLTGQKSVSQILRNLDYLWDNPNATTPPN